MASFAVLAATLAALLVNVVAARLVRYDKRSVTALRVFCALTAIPLFGLAIAASIPQVIAIAGLLGFAVGALTSSIYGVYLAKHSHRFDAGRNFGLIVAAETAPYVVVPLIAAATQATSDHTILTSLFLAGSVFALLAGFASARLLRSR